jgi:hypothetical protein
MTEMRELDNDIQVHEMSLESLRALSKAKSA